jgi:hypothetical protein
MHKTHAADGLAVITVSLDDDDGHAGALKYLQEQKATFTNLRLKNTDANAKQYAEKLPADNPPTLLVFDRTGKQVKLWTASDKDFTPEAVEKLVKELLAKK